MAEDHTSTRPTGFAVWLIIASVIGWWAAFQLTVEKIFTLSNPGANASCDFSVLVQCGANLDSWQGRVFGFTNPIIGITGWMAPLVVGVAIFAGARFARWFWVVFWLGFVFAISFIIWLISQSIFAPNLHTLCPWCMVTWAVTIPSFFVVTVHLLRAGIFTSSPRTRRLGERLMSWVPLMTIVAYGVIILLAQIELNAIPNVWRTIQIHFGWA